MNVFVDPLICISILKFMLLVSVASFSYTVLTNSFNALEGCFFVTRGYMVAVFVYCLYLLCDGLSCGCQMDGSLVEVPAIYILPLWGMKSTHFP